MKWSDNRTLTITDDGPAVLHAWSLAVDLRDAVGDKPSIRSLHGALLAVNFHVDLDAAAKDAVVAIVAAHDGAAENASEAAVRQQQQDDLSARLASLEALRTKRRGGAALTAAERAQAIDLLLGVQ